MLALTCVSFCAEAHADGPERVLQGRESARMGGQVGIPPPLPPMGAPRAGHVQGDCGPVFLFVRKRC